MTTSSKRAEDTTAGIATQAEVDEWVTVSSAVPTRVILDTVGDTFIGEYQGMEHHPFDVHIFKHNGEMFSIGDSVVLARALVSVRKGTKVRIILNGWSEQPSGDRKEYQVDVARLPR